MQLTEAATLDRKSGEAEGSVVRHSCAPLLPAQTSIKDSRERSIDPLILGIAKEIRKSSQPLMPLHNSIFRHGVVPTW